MVSLAHTDVAYVVSLMVSAKLVRWQRDSNFIARSNLSLNPLPVRSPLCRPSWKITQALKKKRLNNAPYRRFKKKK